MTKRDVPIIYDDRLMEMCFGEYEGVANCFEKKGCPMNIFFQKPEEYIVPVEGAESFEDLFARTSEFVKEEVEPRLAKGEDVLIVGHGAMNSSIISIVRKLERKDFWSLGIENCKLMKLA